MSDDTEPSSPRRFSPAVASGIAGGVVVGLSAAVIAFVFIGPLRDYGFDLGDTMLVGLIASVFGVIAGAVAGSGEDDLEPEPVRPAVEIRRAQPTRPAMTPAHRGA
jgi:hypothetical protein